MDVWLVIAHDWEMSQVIGIYSTVKQAQIVAAGNHGEVFKDWFWEIQGVTLDGEPKLGY